MLYTRAQGDDVTSAGVLPPRFRRAIGGQTRRAEASVDLYARSLLTAGGRKPSVTQCDAFGRTENNTGEEQPS